MVTPSSSHSKGLGSAEAKILLSTEMEYYVVGDSAKIQCVITLDGEILERCKIKWFAVDKSNKKININDANRYQHRVNITELSHTHSLMTLKDLARDDTDEMLCTATCIANKSLKRIPSNGISIKFKGKFITSGVILHFKCVELNNPQCSHR